MFKKIVHLEHLENRPDRRLFKRVIWAGTRRLAPKLSYKLQPETDVTFLKDLLKVGVFPALLVWENSQGIINYAKATTTIVTRKNKADRDKLRQDKNLLAKHS